MSYPGGEESLMICIAISTQ